jgi:toxin ParE1/3/4
MKRRIRRTRQVRQDIVDIYAYLHERSPQGAERVASAIERSIKHLLDVPGVGRRWQSPDPRLDGMRVTTVTPYRNYLIFFRQSPGGIEIFRVVHGARELEQIVDAIQLQFDEG